MESVDKKLNALVKLQKIDSQIVEIKKVRGDIPEEVRDAWMVQTLNPKVIGTVSGKVICCDALNKPEHWRE